MWTCVLQKVFRILSLYSPCGGSTTSTVVNTMAVPLTSRACWEERLKATGSILKKTRMLWKSRINLPFLLHLMNAPMPGSPFMQIIADRQQLPGADCQLILYPWRHLREYCSFDDAI